MGLGELGEVLRNLELLKKCFEGVGGCSSERIRDLGYLKDWARHSWRVKGYLHISLLGDSYFF